MIIGPSLPMIICWPCANFLVELTLQGQSLPQVGHTWEKEVYKIWDNKKIVGTNHPMGASWGTNIYISSISSQIDVPNFKAHRLYTKGQVVTAAAGALVPTPASTSASASICPNHISRFFRYPPICLLRFLNALYEASTTLSFSNSMIYSWWE